MNLKKNLELFYAISGMKNIVAPSSSSNFPTKLICWGVLVFVCLDKYMWRSL